VVNQRLHIANARFDNVAVSHWPNAFWSASENHIACFESNGLERNETSVAGGKIMSRVLPSCLTTPLSTVWIWSSLQSRPV
jgi:hypothetical protein